MLTNKILTGLSGHARRRKIVDGIANEIAIGMETLDAVLTKDGRQVVPVATIFGTARTDSNSPECQMAFTLGQLYGAAGFTVLTGAGDRGVMAAGNTAAKQNGVLSLGTSIIGLPHEQHTNKDQLDVESENFFFESREIPFWEYSSVLNNCGGGFGTVREAFNALTLMQCGKMEIIPMFFIDKDPTYWGLLMEFIQKSQFARGHISEKDLALFELTDDPEYAVYKTVRFYQERHPGRYPNLVLPGTKSVTSAKPLRA